LSGRTIVEHDSEAAILRQLGHDLLEKQHLGDAGPSVTMG
jgi:hypothetical protein